MKFNDSIMIILITQLLHIIAFKCKKKFSASLSLSHSLTHSLALSPLGLSFSRFLGHKSHWQPPPPSLTPFQVPRADGPSLSHLASPSPQAAGSPSLCLQVSISPRTTAIIMISGSAPRPGDSGFRAADPA